MSLGCRKLSGRTPRPIYFSISYFLKIVLKIHFQFTFLLRSILLIPPIMLNMQLIPAGIAPSLAQILETWGNR